VAAELENEEQLKDKILAALKYYRNTPEEIRNRDALPRLVDAVFQWCRNCVYLEETHDFGVEIWEAAKRCAQKPHNGDEFFLYLKKALKNGRNKYYRQYKNFRIKVPRVVRDLKKYFENSGKEFTEDEFVDQILHRYLLPEPKKLKEGTREERARSYYRVLMGLDDITRIHSLDGADNEDEEYHILDTAEVKLPYIDTDHYEDPVEIQEHSLFMNMLEANSPQIREKIKQAFINKQERTAECDKALWTLHYIKYLTDFDDKFPLIDSEILMMAKRNEKLPTQAEIWQKYHPKVTKKSAEALSSTRSAKIVEEFESLLKANLSDDLLALLRSPLKY
jgi:hypothetical protein